MNSQTQRGRKVVHKSNSSVRTFYLIVGGVVIMGLAALATVIFLANRPTEVVAPKAPVGQTAEGYWYKGNPDAPIKVVEFSDFECPSCANYARNLGKIVERDYIDTGKVQFIFHELPLNNHSNAKPAAIAARCAADQGKFWQMHDQLFANQSGWAGAANVGGTFANYARTIGIDANTFQTCINGTTHTAAIDAAEQDAVAKGIPATPTFLVDGQQVDSGRLVATIDAALRAKGK